MLVWALSSFTVFLLMHYEVKKKSSPAKKAASSGQVVKSISKM